MTGAEACLGCGPRRRRAQWSGYRPCPQSLSTPMSKNRRNAPKKIESVRSPYLSGLRSRTWATFLRRPAHEMCLGRANTSIVRPVRFEDSAMTWDRRLTWDEKTSTSCVALTSGPFRQHLGARRNGSDGNITRRYWLEAAPFGDTGPDEQRTGSSLSGD